MITQKRLREVLTYDPETGIFRWNPGFGRNGWPTDVAGSPDGHGYMRIGIDGEKYTASRLAFLWMTDIFPAEDCDHKDGDPANDAWSNLRPATTTQNMQNKRIQSNNSSGFKGIVEHRPGIWRARIKASGKQLHLGLFNCPVAAHLAYVVAANKHFGIFARAQ